MNLRTIPAAIVVALAVLLAALPARAPAEEIGGRFGKAPTEVWRESETLSTSWTCHSLEDESGYPSGVTPAVDLYTYGYALETPSSSGGAICFAPNENVTSIVGRDCDDSDVVRVPANLSSNYADPELAVHEFCWRAAAGSIPATFTAGW